MRRAAERFKFFLQLSVRVGGSFDDRGLTAGRLTLKIPLMKSIIRKFTTAAVVAGVLAASTLAATPAGYIDFGSFDPAEGEEYIGLSDGNRDAATDRIEGIRADLDNQGWARIITVRENAGDNIAVFIKQAEDDSIQGVVVTIIGGEGEAVLVNVVGDVQIEQIARLGHRLDIDPLRDLDLKPAPVES